MDLAALIISILALLMASANLIIYLAKHVFSTHTVQLQSVESLLGDKNKVEIDPLAEFDSPTAMDLAFKEHMRK